MRTVTKSDYIGFTFNGIHSSQLGIYSVTSGDRYDYSLFPELQSISVDIPGGDGSYYFGSTLKNKTFSLNIAFDSVTETELREMSNWLYNNGDIATLIFDERPYIKYYVKVNQQPQLKYVPFVETTFRIYKGEGNIQFTAFNPYGYSVYKFLDEYSDTNKSEWETASRFLASKQVSAANFYDTFNAGEIPVYNPGDVPVDFILTLGVSAGAIPVVSLGTSTFTLNLANLGAGSVEINTEKRLIKHVASNNGAISIINYTLADGNLFKIPRDSALVTNLTARKITITNVSTATISYSYKYL